MRKFVVLAGILLLGLLSTTAYAQYYAFGFSGFTGTNNLTINGTQYFNTDSGWINSDGLHQALNTNYYSGEFDCGGANVCRNYFSFDLSSLSGPIRSASFNVFAPSVSVPGPYQIFGTSLTPSQVNSSNGFTSIPYWMALASGPLAGSVSIGPGNSGSVITVALNATGLSWLQSNEGGSVVLGGQFLGGPVPPPVPEPGTIALLGSGVIGLAGVLRRKLLA